MLQTEPTCNYWVWVSTEFETDPDYWYACWYKDKVDQVLARTGVVAGPKICPEGAGDHLFSQVRPAI